jgi:hypothetical protein
MQSSRTPHGVLLATRNLLPFGPPFVQRVVAGCGCAGLDVELARPRFGGVSAAHRIKVNETAPVVVWIRGAAAKDGAHVAIPPPLDRWLDVATALLVVEGPRRIDESLAVVAGASKLAEFLQRSGYPCTVAVGLRGAVLVGGRRHLAGLTLLRRQAEEWGVQLALDLTGPFDPYWEAEAAVLRLSERLAFVRASAASMLPTATGAQRVARRGIRAAIEQSPSVLVSLEPEVAWWNRRNVRALAGSWSDSAARVQPLRGPVMPDAFRLPEEERRWRSLPPR